MNEVEQKSLKKRWLQISVGIGALIGIATLIPYFITDYQKPTYVSLPLHIISILTFPGVVASVVLAGSMDAPNLFLAAIFNFVFYAAVAYWILSRRNREPVEPPAGQ